MCAQDNLLGQDDEEGYPLAATVRYFYHKDEVDALERERRRLEEELQRVEEELRQAKLEIRNRRPWWGKLWASRPGGKQA